MIKEGVKSRRGQLTLLIIVAIVIVLIIVLYFTVLGDLFSSPVPRNMKPVYDSYIECLEGISIQGVYILGQQGGYIEPPEFEPGSTYRPFSNQLDFLGIPIPYWMYVSGNNIIKEQVPTKEEMQEDLEKYIKERVDFCEFSVYEDQGFSVFIEKGDADVRIRDKNVEVKLSNPFTIYFEEDSARVTEHDLEVDIPLGRVYDEAKELYNAVKVDAFLEKYAIDVLRLYAPVDGVKLQCTPEIFVDEEIRENLTKGLTANMNFLKVKGSYYNLQREESEYFVVDPGFSVDTNVNFLYNPGWPTRVEIYGDRVAKPIGVQEGLSILGFCYVPYHLVYDVNFPVLIQFSDGDFIFQYPVSVIIEKNYAREALPPMFESQSLNSPICEHQNQRVKVYTYDSELRPVPSRLQFKCLNAECEVGESKITSEGSVFEGFVPECVNGFFVATAEGYAPTEYQVSTNEQTVVDIILPKIYSVPLDFGSLPGNAVITFAGEKHSTTAIYPQTRTVDLIEDYYNITVFIYEDSSITLDGINEERCVDVPADGIGSLFGVTEEKCNTINIPSMKIDSALVGGGRTQDYITEDQLKNKRELNVQVPIFYTPKSVEDLQANYVLVEDSVIYVNFE